MNVVTKVTNLIRGGNRALNHRKPFLDEVGAAYGDLLIHTDIRWMSFEKCLERFFALHTEMTVSGGQYQVGHQHLLQQNKGSRISSQHAFLTDMTTHRNNLITQLQRRSKTEAFQRKRNLYHNGS